MTTMTTMTTMLTNTYHPLADPGFKTIQLQLVAQKSKKLKKGDKPKFDKSMISAPSDFRVRVPSGVARDWRLEIDVHVPLVVARAAY
jgi:hypothetical protein